MSDGALVKAATPPPFELLFDIGTLKHLGIHMYSTLPPVLGELVSNAWDADATRVDVTIPTSVLDDMSEIVVQDNGCGMSDADVRKAYLVVGRDRREAEGDHLTPIHNRKVMGRKGIGKFSAFGVATQIEVESVKTTGGVAETSRLVMDYAVLEKHAKKRRVEIPALAPTGQVTIGTRVTLRKINKYRTRKISITSLKRRLARRYSILGDHFSVFINGVEVKPEDQDLHRLLEADADGAPYVWRFNEDVRPESGWRVRGWIGALDRTKEVEDAIQRGISIMARGKMVQEPFLFEATVGQQFALSYIVGELHAEFVDEGEDTVATARNSLVWDTESNRALLDWGKRTVNRVAREWAEKRRLDNERALHNDPLYTRFVLEADRIGNARLRKVADRLIKKAVIDDPLGGAEAKEAAVQMCLDYMEYDAFQDLAEDIVDADVGDVPKMLKLFRDWEFLEAKEMARVTEGRIKTIQRFQQLVDENALEVPVLHNFLKEFPWVLDPRWSLVADEVHYSKLLREKFPESDAVLEKDRRIDFLCVAESDTLVVVEIKRPGVVASMKELEQIEEYVGFMRDHVERSTDPNLGARDVVGYLLVGGVADTWQARQKRNTLRNDRIYVRLYGDLLGLVQNSHREILDRFETIKSTRAAGEAVPDPAGDIPAGDGASASAKVGPAGV